MTDKLKAAVTNIQKFSVHDGPGIRSVVFLKGCPLECRWCANPENIDPKPELMVYPVKCIGCGRCTEVCPQHLAEICSKNAGSCTDCGRCAAVCSSTARVMKGEWMTTDEVIRKLDKDMIFYKNSGGGITFSGGEAMLYPEFIAEIAAAYKSRGINTAVETCGLVPWISFEKVIPYNDLFLFDVKFISREKHMMYCGQSNDTILDNLRKLCRLSRVVIRVPMIPSINDSEEELRKLGEFLSELKDSIEGVHCLPYHDFGASKYDALGIEYELPDIRIPESSYMEDIKKFLESYDLKVQIGG